MLDRIGDLQTAAQDKIRSVSSPEELEELRVAYLGRKGKITELIKQIPQAAPEKRSQLGQALNQLKRGVEQVLQEKARELRSTKTTYFDVTEPSIRQPIGHLHLLTYATREIMSIFERIGFTRSRYPEVDTDYYAFESLNMPVDHPARDQWETFYIADNIVITPHTSNGQVREMEKGNLPIRMINIARCGRRQSDVSHAPTFFQFEGLYVDKNVSIAHLKGVIEYFVHNFYGPERQIRLRPYDFRFTEPSFEVDISCGLCQGRGCRFCKGGWVELGGAGMVHPKVLEAGGIDSEKYSGFAFGWGIERTYMMKAGLSIPDIRVLYRNGLQFLRQF